MLSTGRRDEKLLESQSPRGWKADTICQTSKMTTAHLDLRGAGSTDLLFVSGWLGDVHDWDAVRDRLANFATGAYAPEGLSAAPADGGWSFDRARIELDRTLDSLEPSRAVVVGSSASGSVALDAAAERDLRGVIAIGAAPRWIATDEYAFGMPIQAAREIVKSLRQSFAATVRQVMPSAYFDEADPLVAAAVQAAIFERADSVASPNHLIEALESLWSIDITHRLSSIRCPVLLISGDRDRAVPPGVAQLMASRIPHCEVDVIEGAGHMPYVTAADAVSRSIARFMKCFGGEA
jgi:pimeloyl-ACP methyl ester carboxylesterase